MSKWNFRYYYECLQLVYFTDIQTCLYVYFIDSFHKDSLLWLQNKKMFASTEINFLPSTAQHRRDLGEQAVCGYSLFTYAVLHVHTKKKVRVHLEHLRYFSRIKI